MCFSNQPSQLSNHTFPLPAMLGFKNPDERMLVTTPCLCFQVHLLQVAGLETCWRTKLHLSFCSLHHLAPELQWLTPNYTTCTTVHVHFTLIIGKPHNTCRLIKNTIMVPEFTFIHFGTSFICCTDCQTLGGKNCNCAAYK